jgi:hypothetical protein
VRGKGAQGDLWRVNRPAALPRLRLHQVNLCGRLWLCYAINAAGGAIGFLRAHTICAASTFLPWGEPLKRVPNPQIAGSQVHIAPPKAESFTLPKPKGNVA